jgi:AcrR family transcriptional regulator
MTDDILSAALKVAERDGWRAMTRAAVALEAGVSCGTVSLRLGTMEALRRSVMRAAVQRRVLRVVAEGLVAGDRHARRADEALRVAAARHVAGL